MRWQRLFDDLEAQLAAADAAELADEVRDRTRRETALLGLRDRLVVGGQVSVAVHGAGTLRGPVLDVGPDWLLVEEAPGREVLVPARSVLAVGGLGREAEVPGAPGEVGARLDLRIALRALVRSRSAVVVVLVDGSERSGTLDRVGSDHVDLAEHPLGELRRAGAVRQVVALPLTAIAVVRSGG